MNELRASCDSKKKLRGVLLKMYFLRYLFALIEVVFREIIRKK